MASINRALSSTRSHGRSILRLIRTAFAASLCAEIAILAITCIYLTLQRQSPVVIFAFLLIALERRAHERYRRRGSGNHADSQSSPEPADRFARDVVEGGWGARLAASGS